MPREGVRALSFVWQTPFITAVDNGRIINASGVVSVGESRFVFIDNTDPHALLELDLNADGTQKGPLIRRPILGLSGAALSDPEGIAKIEVDGAIELILASSLGVRFVEQSGHVVAHDGLVRVRYQPDGELHGEAMTGFRDWLIAAYPDLVDPARLRPDANGLNIEGLAWDPARRALLFGIRSPVDAGRIPVLGVLLDTDAPWTTAALRPGTELVIEKSDFAEPQGIRDLDYDATRQEFLVLVGRSLSGGSPPFQLCTWDGSSPKLDVLDVTFEPASMKPEGVTGFPGSEVRRVLIVSDAGGFAIVDDA